MLLSCYLTLKRVFKLFPLLSRRGHLGKWGPWTFCQIWFENPLLWNQSQNSIWPAFQVLTMAISKREVGKFVCPWYQGSRPDLLWPSGLTVAFMTLSEAVWARCQADFTLVCYLAGIYSADACQSGTKCLSWSAGSFARLPLSLGQWFQSVISGTGWVSVTWNKLNQKIWRWIQLSVLSINPPGDF